MRLGSLRWNNTTTQKMSRCKEDTRATWVLKAWQRVGHEGWPRVCLPPGVFPKNTESCWLTTRMSLMSTLSFNYIISNRSLLKKVSPKYIPTKNIGEGYWNKTEASGGLTFFSLQDRIAESINSREKYSMLFWWGRSRADVVCGRCLCFWVVGQYREE